MAQMNALSSQKFALKEHRRWLNSDEAEGKRAVFGPLDLKGIQIGRRSLERVVFRYCTFDDASFKQTDISGAEFDSCMFRNATLTGVKASGAKFSACDLSNVHIENMDIEGASFTDCLFANSTLDIITGNGLYLSHCMLFRACLVGDFFDGTYKNCSFVDCDISAVNFGEGDFRYSRFIRVEGASIQMVGAFLNLVTFEGCDFSEGNFGDVAFSGAKIIGCNMERANFGNAEFDPSMITGTNFEFAEFTETRFSGIDFRTASFEGAELVDVDFTNCKGIRELRKVATCKVDD